VSSRQRQLELILQTGRRGVVKGVEDSVGGDAECVVVSGRCEVELGRREVELPPGLQDQPRRPRNVPQRTHTLVAGNASMLR
jgi:hypothetical protein